MKSWIETALFYQIYPLGFCGAPRYHQDKITHTITEIINWIPHLTKMHCNALYLGPVFESSEHGYDTMDYRTIDHRLGDNNDFKRVCDALHDAGIHIILDGVFNHVGRAFWAFLDIQKNRESSPYVHWFSNLRFDGDNALHDGFYYDTWQGYINLVKLNLQNEEVISYLFDTIAGWIQDYHIDGLRLDAADRMDPSFFRRLQSFCRSKKEDFWLMGEIIHGDYTQWANKDMLDAVTNYECYKGLYSSHNERNYFEIGYSLHRQFAKGGIYEHLHLYNFVDNHDVNRLASTLKDIRDLQNVYTILYTMPGIPSLYYGSEWAIKGCKHDGSDADIRPHIILKEQKDGDITRHIAKLGAIRHEHPALYNGSYTQVLLRNEQFVFKRQLEEEILYIALNLNEEPYSCDIQELYEKELYDILHDCPINTCNHTTFLTIPAKSACILAIGKKQDENKTKPAEQAHINQEPQENPIQEETLPLGRYIDYKGEHYTVLYVVKQQDSLKDYVVYRQLFGDESIWVLPRTAFMQHVEVEGCMIPRFRYVGT